MNQQEYYEKSYYGLTQSFPSMVDLNWINSNMARPLLDVGCGQGRNVKELRKNGEAFGCDIFKSVELIGENFFFHDMEKSPTKKKFNSIICVHVLEHVFDYVSFLQNVRESLEPHGRFFLAVPNAYSLLSRLRFFLGDEKVTLGVGELDCIEKNWLEPHLRFFGEKSLKTILELNEFSIIESFKTTTNLSRRFGGGQLNFLCKRVDL